MSSDVNNAVCDCSAGGLRGPACVAHELSLTNCACCYYCCYYCYLLLLLLLLLFFAQWCKMPKG